MSALPQNHLSTASMPKPSFTGVPSAWPYCPPPQAYCSPLALPLSLHTHRQSTAHPNTPSRSTRLSGSLSLSLCPPPAACPACLSCTPYVDLGTRKPYVNCRTGLYPTAPYKLQVCLCPKCDQAFKLISTLSRALCPLPLFSPSPIDNGVQLFQIHRVLTLLPSTLFSLLAPLRTRSACSHAPLCYTRSPPGAAASQADDERRRGRAKEARERWVTRTDVAVLGGTVVVAGRLYRVPLHHVPDRHLRAGVRPRDAP